MIKEMFQRRRTLVRMARLIKATDMDRSFDLAFWKKVGAEGRFSAAWQTVRGVETIRGEENHELRLQKSIEKIRRSSPRSEKE